MNNQKGIDFLKNRIKSRLREVQDQMGLYRFKIYMAMVDECDDFEELKEMAELDLQMELFSYVQTEINPRLEELNMSISDVRKLDSVTDFDNLSVPDNYAIEPSEIADELEDEDSDVIMAALLRARALNEPLEEKYREEILDFQYEGEIDTNLDDIDIDDEGFGDLEGIENIDNQDSDDNDEDEFDLDGDDDNFSELEEYLDNNGENGDTDDNEFDLDSDDFDGLDAFIDENTNENTDEWADSDLLLDEPTEYDEDFGNLSSLTYDDESFSSMTEDEIFNSSLDNLELDDELGDYGDYGETSIMTEDEIFNSSLDNLELDDELGGYSDYGDYSDYGEPSIMTEDEIFIKKTPAVDNDGMIDFGDDDLDDKSDTLDDDLDDDDFDIDGLEPEDLGLGDIEDFEDTETDPLDDIDSLDDSSFDELGDYGLDDIDDTDDSDSLDNMSDADFGDFLYSDDSDIDSLDDIEDSPGDPFSEVDMMELGDFGDQGLEDTDMDDPEQDIFDEFDNLDLDTSYDYTTSSNSKDEDDDPFSDIDESELGILDDSDDYFADSKPIGNNNKANNAMVHTSEKRNRSTGINSKTVFMDGTSRGQKTQNMFDRFSRIGSGSAKAGKKIIETSSKIGRSSLFDFNHN